MRYYNEKGKGVEFQSQETCMYGTSAFITIPTQGVCLKEYYNETDSRARMTLQTFQIIRSLSSSFTYSLYSLLRKNAPFDSEQNVADAYLCFYIPESHEAFLTMDKEIILDNVEGLEYLLVSLFANEKLKAEDLKKENVIIKNGRVRLIDLDNCRVEFSEAIEDIKHRNKERLRLLLKSCLFMDSCFI